jgi:hypothetical protein
MTIIKSLLGALLLVAGVLIVGAGSALAAPATATTQVSLTIPSTISMSGLAAAYNNPNGAAGVANDVRTGPLTINTNNPTGYNLVLTAAGANFTGLRPGNTFGIGADSVSVWDAAFTAINGPAFALSTTGSTIMNTTVATAAGGDTFGVKHIVAPAANTIPDTYSVNVTYTASVNP